MGAYQSKKINTEANCNNINQVPNNQSTLLNMGDDILFKKSIINILTKDYKKNSLITVEKIEDQFYLKIIENDKKITELEGSQDDPILQQFLQTIGIHEGDKHKDYLQKIWMNKMSDRIGQGYRLQYIFYNISYKKYWLLSAIQEIIVDTLKTKLDEAEQEERTLFKSILDCTSDDINDSLLKDGRQLLNAFFFSNQPEKKRLIAAILRNKESVILKSVEFSENMDRQELVNRLTALSQDTYVCNKLLAQAKIWQIMGEIDKMKEYPFKELYRFIIDGNSEKYGDYAFENEPGYILGSMRALLYALQRSENKIIDLNWYTRLHDLAVDSVYVLRTNSYKLSSSKGIASNDYRYFGLGLDSFVDLEGLNDLKYRSNDKKEGPFEYQNSYGTKIIVGTPIVNIATDAKKIFTQMNEAKNRTDNPIERLMIYAWLARELELRHIYDDGNGRASMMLLYSLIAKDKDLPMITFHDPNVLDANGPERLCRLLWEAMIKFENKGKLIEVNNSEKLTTLKQHAIDYFKTDSSRTKWSYFHKLMESTSSS